MLIHRDMVYKQGRHSAKSGDCFKYKDDNARFQGTLIAFSQATIVDPEAEKMVDPHGYSKTSKKKGDRIAVEKVAGFITEYEGKRLIVKPNGFNQIQLEDMWQQQDRLIGRKFIYTGRKPKKDVPLLAHFMKWVD